MCRGTISLANGAIEVEATVIAEAFDLPPDVLLTMVGSGWAKSMDSSALLRALWVA